MANNLHNLIVKLRTGIKQPNEVVLLNIILALSISLLLVVVFFVNQKFSETNDNFIAVSAANNLIAQTSVIESEFFKTGNEVRASMLGHNKSINDSLPRYRHEITTQINNLAELWSHKGGNVKIIDSLLVLTTQRFDLWQVMLKNGSYNDNDSSQSQNVLVGNKVFGKILRLTSDIKRVQYSLLDQYLKNSHKGIKAASILVIVITLLSITLIVFAFTRINREVLNGKDVSYLLENKIKELDRSNQQLEQFAYVASHDLHDPLRKLNVFSERLDQKEKDRLSDDGKELIRRMQKLIAQMQHLIDGLLALSLNYNQLDKKDVNLNKIIEDAKQNLSLKISQSDARIESLTLPIISGYESQLEQLFQNLISNSIRYARKDVNPVIEIKSSPVQGSLIPGVKTQDRQKQFFKLTFIDNGIGFDNKYAEKIFIIFQRLHGKSEYEGSGIGLATCKLVVENHGGYIYAHGKVNEGAEFVIYLPR
jgi:signal transduction histidine kinase